MIFGSRLDRGEVRIHFVLGDHGASNVGNLCLGRLFDQPLVLRFEIGRRLNLVWNGLGFLGAE